MSDDIVSMAKLIVKQDQIIQQQTEQIDEARAILARMLNYKDGALVPTLVEMLRAWTSKEARDLDKSLEYISELSRAMPDAAGSPSLEWWIRRAAIRLQGDRPLLAAALQAQIRYPQWLPQLFEALRYADSEGLFDYGRFRPIADALDLVLNGPVQATG